MTDLTTTAKKIMEVFRYFSINEGDALSLQLFLTRKHLWRDLKEEEVMDALWELTNRGYIAEMEDPPGWRLLEAGAQYIRSLKR